MSQTKINLYRTLYLIRRSQEEISNNYHPEDKMRCPIHLCFGQELMPSILGLFLKKDDSIFSHHRSHGYFLAKGGNLKEMICEFYGKENGTNGGLAGSQELSCSKINFNSGTILSGAFAMAVGDAYAKKINKTKSITVAIIGDGGMEEGIVYESINLAVIKKVPIIFICENNLYSTHTRITERSANNNIVSKVSKFGLRTTKLSNNNYESYRLKIKKELDYVRSQNKPSFIEINTYRLGPHVGPEDDDHFNFRPLTEKKKWENIDPVKHYRKLLLKKPKYTKQLLKIEKKIDLSINEAFKLARNSDYPTLASAFKKNYSNTFSKVVRKFYKNEAELSTIQEKHLPKPY